MKVMYVNLESVTNELDKEGKITKSKVLVRDTLNSETIEIDITNFLEDKYGKEFLKRKNVSKIIKMIELRKAKKSKIKIAKEDRKEWEIVKIDKIFA